MNKPCVELCSVMREMNSDKISLEKKFSFRTEKNILQMKFFSYYF